MSPSPEPESFHRDDDDAIDIADLPRLCGLEQDDIMEYHRLRIVSLHASCGTFHAGIRTLHRLRHISVIREEHDLKPASIGFVLDLMDRLESAERELRTLRERL